MQVPEGRLKIGSLELRWYERDICRSLRFCIAVLVRSISASKSWIVFKFSEGTICGGRGDRSSEEGCGLDAVLP